MWSLKHCQVDAAEKRTFGSSRIYWSNDQIMVLENQKSNKLLFTLTVKNEYTSIH